MMCRHIVVFIEELPASQCYCSMYLVMDPREACCENVICNTVTHSEVIHRAFVVAAVNIRDP